jgi:uncharacterized RDD family membrane protein YckC
MKCPKCGYLGFAQAERCRNCGYDFSLATPAAPDFTLREADRGSSGVDDLVLIDAAASTAPEVDAPVSPPSTKPSASDLGDPGDLPLFTPSPSFDPRPAPRPPTPRPPLAVRRATPEVVRLPNDVVKERPAETAEAELEMPLQAPVSPAVRATTTWTAREAEAGETATLETRAIAAAVDVGLLALLDFVVVYLTLQVSGLTADEVGRLPIVPLAAFLAVQNGAYLIAFTAGGQTIGKMITGVRVVPAAPQTRLDLARAFLRTAVWIVLALPAGAGFLTALFDGERRGLHDRMAGTKVVRVPR